MENLIYKEESLPGLNPHPSRYCLVSVHAPLGRKLFLYEYPQSMLPLSPGDAVLVPFSGREIIGWVVLADVKATEEAEDPRRKFRIKQIVDRVDGAGLDAGTLKLCQGLHEWYGTNFSDILALFVPPSAPKVCKYIERISDEPADAILAQLSGPAKDMARLVDEEGGRLDARKISRRLSEYPPPVIKSALKELARSGAFSVRSALLQVRPGQKKFVGPAAESLETVDTEDLDARIFTDAQKKILDISRQHPFRFGAADVARLARVDLREVRTLVSRRLLSERVARHWRTPLERQRLETARNASGRLDGGSAAVDRDVEGAAGRPAVEFQATPSQAGALEKIISAVDSRRPDRFLLFGPTASGKTFVYEQAARAALAQGRQVLLMVPEIALTKPLIHRILETIAEPVAVMHSRLRPAERRDEWQRCANGSARLLVGPRSAAFVPLPDLGLAIIDECHDAGYKQAEAPYLDARKVMEEKCAMKNAALVLGSATPTVEQLFSAQTDAGHGWPSAERDRHVDRSAPKYYARLDLTHFPTRVIRPEVRLIDLRQHRIIPRPPSTPALSHAGHGRPSAERDKDVQRSAAGHGWPSAERDRDVDRSATARQAFLSRELLDMIADTLKRHESVVLLLNRRGFAPLVSCPSCGYSERCKDCLLGMTYHLQEKNLICHSCGKTALSPSACPACGYIPLGYMGAGTERIVEALRSLFPRARLARLDQDAFRKNRQAAFKVLEDLKEGRIDILIGTQMIAKGLDVPRVTLAAVVLADVGLNLPDFRSSERTFQLLAQLIGRSGRHHAPGRAAIQTFKVRDPAILHSITENTTGFFSEDLILRQNGGWPPFVRLARILVQSSNAPLALQTARQIHAHLASNRTHSLKNFREEISPPLPAARPKINGEYRFQMLIKIPVGQAFSPGIFQDVCETFKQTRVKIHFEPDPISLL